MKPQVLIVGAGPTGLVLALWLARLRVPFRIVEKNSGAGQASRAMVVQARTLEFYRQLGFADEVVRGGIKICKLHLREDSREIAGFEFEDLGEGLSPYPFVLSFPQDDHERLLGEKLKAAGIEIEWNTELGSFADGGDHVRVILRKNGAEETRQFAYLCGCDGARSAVREGLKLNFPGGIYQQMFYVADLEATGNAVNGDINLCLGADEFGAAFPIRSSGMLRLIGVVPEELTGRANISFEDIRPRAEKLIDVQVQKANWFSTYHVHHRVSEHFRVGRVFVAGDAGHLHSPAGGQGMNTGIGDAVNLSWKLAAVLKGQADPNILDTYETERIAFARSLVSTTDKLFQAAVGRSIGSSVFRTLLFPHLLPFMLGFAAVRRAQFHLISQTRINYRDSALSDGRVGHVHGGDRLPWVEGGNGGNYEPLQSVDWQIHVYGEAAPPLRDAAGRLNLALHSFAWSDQALKAGFRRDALYLVRPDGYVALANREQDVVRLQRMLFRFRIAPLNNVPLPVG
ncbi:MAG: FAD-dependent monooxygenase [Candidatus Binataceae bacterium]